MMRAHRRRFVRQYGVLEQTMDDEEIEKFERGVDGAIVKFKREGALKAIDAPNLGSSMDQTLLTAPDDLNKITGISTQARQAADRTTATEATLINQKGAVREDAEQKRVVRWLRQIGREVLLTAREKLVIGTWITLTSDSDQFLGEVKEEQETYKFVTSEDLNDGYDFRINVDVTSISTVAQEQEKQSFMEFLALVSQYPQVAMSPKLIRECAYRVGYRNESVIRELQKMALLTQMGQAAQLQQQGVQLPQPGGAQRTVAAATPPKQEQIRNQIANQIQ
jgi:hypothetical protein